MNIDNQYTNIIVNINNKICNIILNRVSSKNAINQELANELKLALYNADKNQNISVIILSSALDVFSVGADLKEIQEIQNNNSIKDFLKEWDFISVIEKPIIACVNGYALGGGCELSLMCDIIIASSEANFSQPEIKVGLIPGAGGTQRIVRTVGKAQAMDICLSGKLITAFEALNLGLISRVTEPEKLKEETFELANILASYPLENLKIIKKNILSSFEQPLKYGLQQERYDFYEKVLSENAKEGIASFIEKRLPNFTN